MAPRIPPERIEETVHTIRECITLGVDVGSDALCILALHDELARRPSAPGMVPTLTDAELDAVYPECKNWGTVFHDLHRKRLRDVVALAFSRSQPPLAPPGSVLVSRTLVDGLREFLARQDRTDEVVGLWTALDAHASRGAK